MYSENKNIIKLDNKITVKDIEKRKGIMRSRKKTLFNSLYLRLRLDTFKLDKNRMNYW